MPTIVSLAPGLLLRTEQPLSSDPLSPAFVLAENIAAVRRCDESTVNTFLHRHTDHMAVVGAWQIVTRHPQDLTRLAPLTWVCDICETAPASRLARWHGDTILCAPCAAGEEDPHTWLGGYRGESLSHLPTPTTPLRTLPVLLLLLALLGFAVWAWAGTCTTICWTNPANGLVTCTTTCVKGYGD